MDRRERWDDGIEAFRAAFAGHQSYIWTAMPGIINSVNAPSDMPQTVNVKVPISISITDQDGSAREVELPLLLDCPLIWPSGGGFTLTFPVEAGDECLVVFASRCIDNWYAQTGAATPNGARTQADIRMHDLSDGFVIVGPRNKTRPLPAVSTTDVQLRSDAGTAVISIRENSDVYIHSDANVIVDSDNDVFVQAGGDVNVTAAGNVTVTAVTINLIGEVNVTGDVNVSGQTNTATLAVVAAANFGGAIVHTPTGKDIGGNHEHDHGTMTATGHTGTVI